MSRCLGYNNAICLNAKDEYTVCLCSALTKNNNASSLLLFEIECRAERKKKSDTRLIFYPMGHCVLNMTDIHLPVCKYMHMLTLTHME